MFVNVNYLIVDPVYETAYRSDVTRVETTSKMAIKPSDDFVREEDFCNVTVSFRETLQIMLQKKYETFFTIKLQGDEEEAVERDEKVFQLERNRKRTTKIVESLTSKGLQENYEERSFLKLMKGPFYKLISKEGPREDDFYTCGTRDLINTVNAERMKVLITGKPRSGKTTLAKAIEKRLNLARISADVWI
jgi:tRNA uridine 5-carbamoylmethylation protein Kti12